MNIDIREGVDFYCKNILFFRNLDIGVTLKDAAGRVFDGIESVAIDWVLSDGVLAKLAKSRYGRSAGFLVGRWFVP